MLLCAVAGDVRYYIVGTIQVGVIEVEWILQVGLYRLLVTVSDHPRKIVTDLGSHFTWCNFDS